MGVIPSVTSSTPLRLVVLGDSLAYGTGAARRDETLGARLRTVLEESGYTVELHVLAVPGAVSADLDAQVHRAAALTPDVALVVVGANDLARLLPPADAAEALGAAATALRGAGADVVVVTAPDMSVAPAVPAGVRPLVRAGCAELERLQVVAAEAAGAVVARLGAELAAPFASDRSLFSADRYHPSGTGYGVISARLAPVVLAAADRRRDAAA